MSFNVVYIGSSGRGCDYINCHPDFNVLGVICQRSMVNEDLLTCCYLRDIPLFEIKNYADLKHVLEQYSGKIDFALMFIFSIILKPDLLSQYQVFNIHISNLPYYKGKNSTFFATIKGEKRIGISLHKVVAQVDEGAIISQRDVPYYFWMGESALRETVIAHIPDLLTDLTKYINDPQYQTMCNNNDHYFPPINSSMLEINEETPVKDIINLIRSQDCYSGGKFIYNGVTYLIKEVKVALLHANNQEPWEINNRILLKNGQPAGIMINDNHYLRLKVYPVTD